jgi:hypothetical protein
MALLEVAVGESGPTPETIIVLYTVTKRSSDSIVGAIKCDDIANIGEIRPE